MFKALQRFVLEYIINPVKKFFKSIIGSEETTTTSVSTETAPESKPEETKVSDVSTHTVASKLADTKLEETMDKVKTTPRNVSKTPVAVTKEVKPLEVKATETKEVKKPTIDSNVFTLEYNNHLKTKPSARELAESIELTEEEKKAFHNSTDLSLLKKQLNLAIKNREALANGKKLTGSVKKAMVNVPGNMGIEKMDYVSKCLWFGKAIRFECKSENIEATFANDKEALELLLDMVNKGYEKAAIKIIVSNEYEFKLCKSLNALFVPVKK